MSNVRTNGPTRARVGAIEARHHAASALGALSVMMKPGTMGLGQKVVIAGALLRLARRFPIVAVVSSAVALTFYLYRSRDPQHK